MDYVSRAELGWPASAAPDQAVPVKGFKIHYEGTPVPVVEHSKCAGRIQLGCLQSRHGL